MAVTGPGSGIGRAISIRFAEEGGSIVLAGRKPDVLEEVRLICSIILSAVIDQSLLCRLPACTPIAQFD